LPTLLKVAHPPSPRPSFAKATAAKPSLWSAEALAKADARGEGEFELDGIANLTAVPFAPYPFVFALVCYLCKGDRRSPWHRLQAGTDCGRPAVALVRCKQRQTAGDRRSPLRSIKTT
jgi:hypothetical protein